MNPSYSIFTCTSGVVVLEYVATVNVCLSLSSYGSKLSLILAEPPTLYGLGILPPLSLPAHPVTSPPVPMSSPLPAVTIPAVLRKSLRFIVREFYMCIILIMILNCSSMFSFTRESST